MLKKFESVLRVKSAWNSPTFNDVFPSVGYPMYTSLTNLGEIADITYSLNKLNQFEITSFLSSNNSANKQIVNSDIINFQAQYGFDAREGEQASPMVINGLAKCLILIKTKL